MKVQYCDVRLTYTERKIGLNSSVYPPFNRALASFQKDVQNTNNYHPFGMMMPERSYTGVNYRFGFNGQEKDDEVKGNGNSLSFTFRIYDSRLGRFLSIDPLYRKYPWLTPYQFASNMPINSIDIEGKENLAANIAISLGMWAARLQTATSDIIQSSSGSSNFNNASVPIDVQRKLKAQQFCAGAQVYGEALKVSSDAAIDFVTSIPGVDEVGDLSGTLYYGAQGDFQSAGIYGAALFIPAVSGSMLKEAKPLIKGFIKVFENDKQVEKEAFKFGNYGHAGTKEYNSIVSAVKKGGNFVAKSKEEAMNFLNAAFKDIPDQTGKGESKYGFRIDSDEAKESGLQQGHQGFHINYYDKENKVSGTIIIDK